MDRFTTICENYLYRRAYQKGKSYVSSGLVTYVLKNRVKKLRVGITTSKKIGNAVCRNRSRRVIREAVRQLGNAIPPGYDLVFVARTRTHACKSTDIAKMMRRHLEEAGVIR